MEYFLRRNRGEEINLRSERCGYAVGTILAGEGIVETVFSNSLNLRLSSGMCLSVVESKLGWAPNRIQLNQAALDSLAVQPGLPVRVTSSTVYIGGSAISFQADHLKSFTRPVPSPESLEALKKVLISGRGSCRAYLGLSSGGDLEQAVARYTSELEEGHQVGYKLVGLGSGFTPAGDDVLTGFIALASRMGWLDSSWYRELVERAFLNTTSLSATSLYFAGLGQVEGYLDNVLQAMASPVRLMEAVMEAGLALVNEVGSTSGSDMLMGVLSVGRFYLRQQRGDRFEC